MSSFSIPNRCPECNQVVVLCGEWTVVDGDFVLSCDECSATILTVPAEAIAKRLTDGQVWL